MLQDLVSRIDCDGTGRWCWSNLASTDPDEVSRRFVRCADAAPQSVAVVLLRHLRKPPTAGWPAAALVVAHLSLREKC